MKILERFYLLWISRRERRKINVPASFELPCDCRLYPSGEFVRTDNKKVDTIFRIVRGQEHARYELFCFAQLVADGFLDELSAKLEAEATKLKEASNKIGPFLTSPV